MTKYKKEYIYNTVPVNILKIRIEKISLHFECLGLLYISIFLSIKTFYFCL